MQVAGDTLWAIMAHRSEKIFTDKLQRGHSIQFLKDDPSIPHEWPHPGSLWP